MESFMILYKYDRDGYFVGEVVGSSITDSTTTIKPPKDIQVPKFIDGNWVEVFDKELSKIHDKYDEIVRKQITGKFSKFEIDTFETQRSEWHNWKLDANSLTPTIDAIAEARGIDRTELLSKVEKNVLQISTLLGAQQAEEDTYKKSKLPEVDV